MFSTALTGLPNAGKSTLFKALTKLEVHIAPYAFTTIEPNVAKVPVPDHRLQALSQLIGSPKTTPAFIEFVDVAGLVRGAHQGQGLGNRFLSRIDSCQTILLVVAGFESQDVQHPEATVDPERDIAVLKYELLMKDLAVAQSNWPKIKKQAAAGSKEDKNRAAVFEKILAWLESKKPLKELGLEPEEINLAKQFQWLTNKTVVYFVNSGERDTGKWQALAERYQPLLVVDAKLESELAELSDQEKTRLGYPSLLDRVISTCYNALDLITFYTVAGFREIRVWPAKKGATALDGAAMVHSDFAQKFVRAEVIAADVLLKTGSLKEAREKGMIKTVGKKYQLQDGEVVEFKI